MWSMLHKKQYIVLSNLRIPPFHWWRTVFYPNPRHHPLHDRARRRVDRVQRRRSPRLLRARLRPRVVVAHLENHWRQGRGRRTRSHHARQDLRLRLESPEHLRHAGGLRVAAVSAADHRQGIAGEIPRARLAPASRRPSLRRSWPPRPRRHSAPLAGAGVRRPLAPDLRRGHAQSGRPRRPLQGRQLSARDRGRAADCPAGGDRHAAGDAQRTARAPSRPTSRLVVHDPIQPPAIETPTVAGRSGARRPGCMRSLRIVESEHIAEFIRASHVSCTAIIAAGGRGLRFGGASPKQLLEVGGRAILERSVAAFLAHPAVNEVVVALPQALTDDPPAYLRARRQTAAHRCRRCAAAGFRRERVPRRRCGQRRHRHSRCGAAVCERGLIAPHDRGRRRDAERRWRRSRRAIR